MLKADEVKAFIEGRDVYSFDPETKELAAVIHYGLDGHCLVRFEAGGTDKGVYGFEADRYWTRYETFREGKRHSFGLDPLGPGIAQAYFADGTIAFLQAHSMDLSGLTD
jgi:hypothetical protein